MVEPCDIGRMRRLGLGVVGFVVIGAIKEQADVQAARTGGSPTKAGA